MGTSLGGIAILAIGGLVGFALLNPDDTANPPVAAKKAASSVAGIPADYLALYQSAAGTCPNLDWALLAGVGWVETHHGTLKVKGKPAAGVLSGANSSGAMGPMQFLRRTWNGVRVRHPEIGSNVYDPANAIPAAAHKLCDDGVRAGNIDGALLAYNPSSKYVRDVKKKAAQYR